MATMRITCTALVLLIQTLQCLASDDSPFQLTNKNTGFCLVKTNNNCNDVRWTNGDRLLVQLSNKCLGVQGKSVGSEISLHECDENSDLQKWECKNGTLLALKGQEFYIELTADNTAVLSKTVGPNDHLTISGTSSGACARTYRELFAINGNAAGLPCMFPFKYKDKWYSNCITLDSPERHLWCAVETKYQSEHWGFCPVTTKGDWNTHPTKGEYYQLNSQSALTWPQAEASCKQQGASLLSIYDFHQQAFVTALLGTGGNKLWTGLFLDPEHGWKWSNGRPYRYMNWDSGHPLADPGHNCAIADPAVQYSWQSSLCSKKLGYICYSKAAEALPTKAAETGFCSASWIPYNGHCFNLNRTQKTWPDAQRDCRFEGGDLATIRNVEDQSFVISQLGYKSTDDLWIGLNDRKTEGQFDWIDHSTVSFTSWEFGKPAVSTDIKDCILIRGENGNWADRVCEEKHGSICMKMSASIPSGNEVEQDNGCKRGWRKHGSYCYFIGIQTKTLEEAKDDCRRSNSYLADVSNAVDNAFLVSFVGLRPEKYFWLGLSNQNDIDQFVWTNANSVRFTHWNAEMPGHRQGCVAMTTGFFAGLWDVLPCTNKEKYICKHLAEGEVLTPAPPSVTPTKCTVDWTRLGSRNYCFKLFERESSDSKTWYEARDFCMALGGDLLSIHSSEELKSIQTRYDSGRTWIGLSAPDPTTGYVWSDGSPLHFQHWEVGEPNNRNNAESCTEMQMYSVWKWNDVHCERYRNWLCQIRAGVTPNPTPGPVTPDYNRTSDGWLEWNGNQYYINENTMAMEEARHFCQKRHSDLVTINNEAERVFLWKQVSRTHSLYWIGLYVDLDGTYGWMDGTPVVFQRWDINRPDSQNYFESCAVMSNDLGFWHAYNCGYEHKSICKRTGSPPANATVAPTVLPKGGCPKNWKQFDLKCYSIINTQKETFNGAETQCRAMGGKLASILSRKAQVFLTTQLAEAPTTDLWIGLHLTRVSSFLWIDGRPMRYTNWEIKMQYPLDYDYENIEWSQYRRHEEYIESSLPRWNEERNCGALSTNRDVGIGKWIKKSCNDTNGYVCLQNVDPSLPDSPEPIPTDDYVKILNDSIKVVTQNMSWDAAKQHCERDGATLASLRNEWSQAYVELMALKLNASLWIGMNKNQTAGYFRFIDGRRITFTKWGREEPSSFRSCVIVDVNGNWITTGCNQNLNSICMKSTDVPPKVSSDFPGFCPDDPEMQMYTLQRNSWLQFRGFCYLFFTDRMKWPDASAGCVRHGGTLASITDPSEQEFIHSNIISFQDQSSFWIGLYKTHRGMWQWLDRSVMDYSNWLMDQPGDHTYGAIRVGDGRWITGNQWYDRGYICKTAKVVNQQVTQTTVTPGMDPQTRGHVFLIVSLVIIAIVIGTLIALFLFKKSGRSLLIPKKLSTLNNSLFFNNERSKPDVVEIAEEENLGLVITL
ncbi:macrophage mannose receptor 1-like isoform X3 [Pseudochaenichthys georgianus]|uniref:macrophage mannose receptor 1-like isoform X3 n=1 Tax=Pseudochaenichthys georgianus TaxID=52239 RepID=UPI00146A81F6|nr:macrophage mannose receptor 1-like isoform X3 [Pseudochaenichthys georgianus]